MDTVNNTGGLWGLSESLARHSRTSFTHADTCAISFTLILLSLVFGRSLLPKGLLVFRHFRKAESLAHPSPHLKCLQIFGATFMSFLAV